MLAYQNAPKGAKIAAWSTITSVFGISNASSASIVNNIKQTGDILPCSTERKRERPKYGRQILFTPPYWPQLQPIEEARGIVKSNVVRHRARHDHTVKQTPAQLKAAFREVTPAVWEGLIEKAYHYGVAIKGEIMRKEQQAVAVDVSFSALDESNSESDEKESYEEDLLGEYT